MNKEQIKGEIIWIAKGAILDNAEISPMVEFMTIEMNDLDHVAEEIADKIYNAGYRKVVSGRDDFVSLLNEEIKELSIIEKTRKETAREILRTLYNYPHEYHEDKIKELAKTYGVEIEK